MLNVQASTQFKKDAKKAIKSGRPADKLTKVIQLLERDWKTRYTTRHYDAELGRFIGRDPLGTALDVNWMNFLNRLRAGSAYHDGMSLYGAYFVVNGMDRSGLTSEPCCELENDDDLKKSKDEYLKLVDQLNKERQKLNKAKIVDEIKGSSA